MKLLRDLAPVILIVACASPCMADHCPEESITPGPADTVMCGIDVANAHMEDLIQNFGSPTSSHASPCDGCPSNSGANSHAWKLGTATLTASTEFYTDAFGKKIEPVLVMKLQGDNRAKNLRTGRGLRLGDSAATVKRLYGTVFRTAPVNSERLPGSMMTYCFSDESELSVGIENGRVTSILVFISEE